MVRVPSLRRSRRSVQVVAAAALAACASIAGADTLIWTNTSANSTWAQTANWYNFNSVNPHAYPMSGDMTLFEDAPGGGGAVYLVSPQTIDTLELLNVSNSYTFSDTNTPSPATTLSLNTLEADSSTITNTFAASLGIHQASASAIQIYPGSGTLDFQGAITAPQGLNINNGDGQVVLENSGNSIGAVNLGGGSLVGTSPAALAGIGSIEMSGSGLLPMLSVVATDGQSVSGLPNITVDSDSVAKIRILLSNPNVEPLGTPGLNPTTITFNSLTLSSGSDASLSTSFSPYTLGFTTLNLYGDAEVSTSAGNLYSPRSHASIGSIFEGSTGATLSFDGGGVTTISANSSRTGASTIFGGMVVLNAYKALGTGAITVDAGIQDPGGQFDPGGALDLAVASGAGFPSMVNVGAFAALGGNLANAIYSGAGQNVSLSANAILFPSAGSALPGQVSGHAAYWLGVTDNTASYSVGDGTSSIYQGAALGAFTTDGALPTGGFVGTISDPFNQDLLVHASGFTAIGRPSSTSDGQPVGAGTSPTFNSTNHTADLTYDGAGAQLAFFAPISGTATTINLANSNAAAQDSYFSLNTPGDVASGQTYNLQSGTLLSQFQANDVQGTVNIDSGAVFLHDSPAGASTGNFHVLSGGTLQVTSQISAPGSGATYTWDSGSILEFFNATVNTASSNAAQTWVSPNSDILIDYMNTVTNSLSGVGISLLSTRRITTDKGGILFGGSGLAPAAGAGASDTFVFSAAENAILNISDSVTVASGQTLQFGTATPWGPANLPQNGVVVLGGTVNAQQYNVVAGTLEVDSTVPSTANVSNIGVFDMEGTASVNAITGAGRTYVGGNGWLTANTINQNSMDVEGAMTVAGTGTISSVTGGGVMIVNGGANFNAGDFSMGAMVNNGHFTMTGSGTVGGITGTGTLTLGNGSNLQIAPDTGLSTQNGLTLQGNGTLDITDNQVLITYAPNNGQYNASVESAIRTALISGFAGGAWTGTGITSSTAAADAATGNQAPYFGNAAVGYGDNNFLGRTDIPTNSVLVRLTYYGDSDLNGEVDVSDFQNWLAGYQNQHSDPTDFPVNWLDGDFLYEGHVTTDGFQAWLSSYQQDLGSLDVLEHDIQTSTLSPAQQETLLNLISAVPEPGSVGLLLIGTTLLMPRRRRR